MGKAEKVSQITKLVNRAAGFLSDLESKREAEWQEAEIARFSNEWAEAVHIVRFLMMAYEADTMGPVHAAEFEALRDRFMAADAAIRAMGLDNPFAGAQIRSPLDGD